MSVNGAATPGEAHPWYASSGTLDRVLAWLEESGTWTYRICIPGPLRACFFNDLNSIEPSFITFHEVALTRAKAMGRAPYVGCPFIYTWQVAVDSHGRQVAERESRIKYVCGCPRHWTQPAEGPDRLS